MEIGDEKDEQQVEIIHEKRELQSNTARTEQIDMLMKAGSYMPRSCVDIFPKKEDDVDNHERNNQIRCGGKIIEVVQRRYKDVKENERAR